MCLLMKNKKIENIDNISFRYVSNKTKNKKKVKKKKKIQI